MKYTVYFLSAALLITCPAMAQRGKFMQRILEKKLDKNAAENTGPAPDYGNLFYWAASPYKHDAADSIPAFLKEEVRDSSADVFFIHPTTYIKGTQEDGADAGAVDISKNRSAVFASMKTAAWNADVDDTALNNYTDGRTILNQATVFNGSCRVFAPRYRQANLKAFIVRTSPEAKKAFDLAYSDVKRAFQYYLEYDNHGRPVIIASHSQGSLHAIRLLQEFFDGKPLQKQLVCAYVVGHQIETGAFAHIPVCNSPAATGCFVGWRTFQKGESPKAVQAENGNSVCVNPLTWSTGSEWAGAGLNTGSLYGFNNLKPGYVGAGIEPSAKILWVSLPPEAGDKIQKMKNLHIFDYNLFWMNIRENVKQRAVAYLAATH
jgi:hypothetical protein